MPAAKSVVPEDLVITMREVGDNKLGDGVGDTLFLKVTPPGLPEPGDAVKEKEWFDALVDEASRGFNPPADAPDGESPPVSGDVLVFIHGYNNDLDIIMKRHRQLRKDLTSRGFEGAVVSFDWPSGNQTLGYIQDRVKASEVAVRLVNDLVFPFAARVRKGGCLINVHVLAHSTGAYLFQEAVDISDEHHGIADVNWTVSQLLLIGADIDQPAMANGHGDGESMIKHATRVTNYSNPMDDVLKLSNVKRLGLDPRIGRVGLPAGAPANAVNVNCGDYFAKFRADGKAKFPVYGTLSHSWHIGDPVWSDDFYSTLKGDLDRNFIPTRGRGADDGLILRPEPPTPRKTK